MTGRLLTRPATTADVAALRRYERFGLRITCEYRYYAPPTG